MSKTIFRVTIFVLVILFMANLNALVDFVLHPQINYFDEEHLIVGGGNALATAILFGALVIYIRRLEKALREIKALKGLLPICSNCMKIRGQDGKWHRLEDYMSERADVTFTHGICPECSQELYGDEEQRMEMKK